MSDVSQSTGAFPVSWEELHRDTRTLARRLLALPPFIGIVAVSRGGLVPAAIIARELGIRLVDTVCIASYDDRTQGDVKIVKAIDGDGEGMLVIDDLVDTGATSSVIRKILPKAYFATVYAKPAGRAQVDLFVTEVAQDTWILFPWDMAPEVCAPLHTVHR